MKTLKVPKKYFVGCISLASSGQTLGYMSPHGDDVAGKKRLASVQEWINRAQPSYHKLGVHVIDNSPQLGYKLLGVLSSYTSGGSDRWQVQDPRGFCCDISSQTLADLISSCNIEQGEILNPCVWGRMGSANMLINCETEAYQAAVKNTQVSETSASWRDVALGNTIILQNGIEGTYLGKVGVITRNYFDSTSVSENMSNGIRVNNAFFSAIFSSDDNLIHLVAAPKLSGILTHSEISAQEAETALNHRLEQGASLRSHVFFTRPIALFCMENRSDTVCDLTLELEGTEETTVPRSYQKLLLCKYSGGFGEYVAFSNRTICYEIDSEALKQNQYLPELIWAGSARNPQQIQKHQQIDASDINGYFHLYCNFKTPCGGQFRIRV
jgi:hypothetical protein